MSTWDISDFGFSDGVVEPNSVITRMKVPFKSNLIVGCRFKFVSVFGRNLPTHVTRFDPINVALNRWHFEDAESFGRDFDKVARPSRHHIQLFGIKE